MAEQTKIEGVYEIRIEQGAALREFERLNKQLKDTRAAKADLNKETKDLIKAETQLSDEIKAAGFATSAQAKQLEAVKARRAEVNRLESEATLIERGLSGQTRELSNDLSGLTANGLRFRDKMAAAFQVANDGKSAFAELSTESDRLNGSLKGIEASLKASEQQLEFLNAAQKEGKITQEQYAEQTAKVNREIEAGKAANAVLKTELEQVTIQANKLEAELGDLNKRFNDGQISQQEYRQGLQQIEFETRKAGEATAGLSSKFDNFIGSQGKELKSNLSSLALQYVGVGAAIYGLQSIIGGAIKTIADFDQGLSRIRALGGGYAENIGAIGEAARTAGIDFGFSASQSLDAVEALAKAGLTSEQILSGGLTQSLALAAAGSVELGTAAEYVASTLSQFGLEGEQAAQVVDALTGAAVKGQGDVEDFANGLKFVGPIAASMNVSLQETIGTLAVFAEQGVKGEQAGTTLRGVLSSLTSPSKEATAAMRELGIVTDEGNKLFDATSGKFLGLANLSEQLKTATAGLTDEERSQALGRIFGNQQITGATILLKDGKKAVEDWTKAVSEQGFAETVAAEKTNNLKGDVARLGAQYDALVLSVENGNGALANAFREAAQWVSKLLSDISDTSYSAGELKRIADRGFWTDGIVDPDDFNDLSNLTVQLRNIRESLETAPTTARYENAISGLQSKIAGLFKGIDEGTLEIDDQAALDAVKIYQDSIDKLVDGNNKLVRSRAGIDENGKQLTKSTTDQAGANEVLSNTLNKTTTATEKLSDAERERIRLREELTKAEQEAGLVTLKPQEREVAQATAERDTRVADAGDDAKLLIRIEEDYQRTLTEIRTRYALEQQAAQGLSEQQLQQARQQRAVDELEGLADIHAAQLEAAAAQGTNLSALVEQQETERAALVESIRTGEIDALTAQYEADYAALDGNLIAQYDRQTQFQEERAALLAGYREQDVATAQERADALEEINRQEIQAEQNLQDAKIAAIGGFANALSGLAKDGTAAAKVFFALEKASAGAQVVVNLQRQLAAIRTATSVSSIAAAPLGPIAVAAVEASGAARQTTATIQAGVSLGIIGAQAIAGFAEGGEVSGTVSTDWGPRIKRRNGDNVLVRAGRGFVTLRTGEKVLNKDQQRELEKITHTGIWGDIGMPMARNTTGGFASGGPVSIRRSVRGTALVNLGGGPEEDVMLNYLLPRPSPETIVQSQIVSGLEEFANRPMSVSVEEYSRVENRVDVSEQMNRL